MRKNVSPFSRTSSARTCSDYLGLTELGRKVSPVRRVNLNVFRNLKTERTRIHFLCDVSPPSSSSDQVRNILWPYLDHNKHSFGTLLYQDSTVNVLTESPTSSRFSVVLHRECESDYLYVPHIFMQYAVCTQCFFYVLGVTDGVLLGYSATKVQVPSFCVVHAQQPRKSS